MAAEITTFAEASEATVRMKALIARLSEESDALFLTLSFATSLGHVETVRDKSAELNALTTNLVEFLDKWRT